VPATSALQNDTVAATATVGFSGDDGGTYFLARLVGKRPENQPKLAMSLSRIESTLEAVAGVIEPVDVHVL
jgi:hypothetical protein